MIGTWRDTLLNVVVFVYVAWLVWLWLKPAHGPLMPSEADRDADQSRASGADADHSGPTAL